MKITFKRTGGFAGLRLALNLELENLPADEALNLQKLVNDTDFFHIPEPDSSKSPNGFQYTLMVEQDDQQRTLHVSDGTLSEQLQPLINDLSLRARSQRR